MFKKPQPLAPSQGTPKSILQTPALYPVNSVDVILSEKKIQLFIARIETLVHVAENYWEYLYKPVITQYIEFVQALPAIKYPQFNRNNGLLELGLRRAIESLLLHRKQTPIQQRRPGQIPAYEALLTYALFTASIFYGLGHVVATYWVSLCDPHGLHSKRWNPVAGSMGTQGTYYRCSFETINRDKFANYMTPLLAKSLMPELGFVWLSQDKELFEVWLAFLQNDVERGGFISKMIVPFEHAYYSVQEFIHPYAVNEKYESDIPEKEENISSLSVQAQKRSKITASSFTGEEDATELSLYFKEWLGDAMQGVDIRAGRKLSVNKPEALLHFTKEGLLLAYPELLEEFLKDHPTVKKNTLEIARKLQMSGIAQAGIMQYILQQTQGRTMLHQQAGAGKAMFIDPTLVTSMISPSNLPLSVESSAKNITYPALGNAQKRDSYGNR